MAPTVSVVIPTWNGGAPFRDCLRALSEQTLGPFELVVVDSGSTDGTREAAQEFGATVQVIDQRTFNHGGTRNLGIARSSGDVVCLLTQDAVPTGDGYLAALTAAFDDAAVDGAYARQLPRADCDPLIAERLRRWSASRSEPVRQTLAPRDPAAARARFEELPPMERYLTCAFDNVASAVRRSSWEAHPFPERNFGEDVAWAREVLLGGGTIAFEPGASVEHSHRVNLRAEFARLYRDHKNLSALFELRNVPTWGDVWRGWGHQRRFYRELLASQELGTLERMRWRLFSVPYALAETSAQFLGARSHWKVRQSALWRRLDARMIAD